MRTTAPPLLPLFRSDGQGRLLARIYLHKPVSVADLARDLGLDDGGITREADRLEHAGLVRSERLGRNRILHANEESPYYRDLYNLLLKAFGPGTVLGTELSKVDGVQEAYIYGSWAARYAGEPGPDPADLDVIVVGDPASGLELNDVAIGLYSRLGREVNLHVVDPAEWDAAESGFLREVQRRPLVPIQLARVSNGA
jgi:DNA-binding transcriptional ArsR family regulator